MYNDLKINIELMTETRRVQRAAELSALLDSGEASVRDMEEARVLLAVTGTSARYATLMKLYITMRDAGVLEGDNMETLAKGLEDEHGTEDTIVTVH